MLHACFSILLFMYEGKNIAVDFQSRFSRNAYFTGTSVCDVADDTAHFCSMQIKIARATKANKQEPDM